MATKGCYILSRLAFIFLLLFLLWQKWHLSNRLPWNRGYIYRDCVLLLIFTSPVRHLFKERKWVMVTSHDMNDLICLKLLHAIFFFFFVTALSLPQPNRQEEGKCYFTTQTRWAHYWETDRKCPKEKKRCSHSSSSSMHAADYQCCCCWSKKKKNLAGASSLIYFYPHHYLIFGYKHTDCATR